MENRKIARITSSPAHQGFLGQGHLAAAVIDGSNFMKTDPFILLMDDRLDLPGGPPVGGPHPHAGFETVTLVLKGDEKTFKTGSLEVMTAGKGIIHTEELTAKTQMRILQLWLVLPPDKRWAEPFWQLIPLESVPTVKTDSSEIRVYSGHSQGLTSPMQNNVPFTLVDFRLDGDSEAVQEIPASYTGFVYLLEGDISIEGTKVEMGKAAWFEPLDTAKGNSAITFTAGKEGARLVLYAGEPQHAPIVSHGPFIGDTRDDINRLYREYREGEMPHLNELPDNRKMVYQ